MPQTDLSEELREEYQRLFDSCIIDEEQFQVVERLVSRIEENKIRYEAVGTSCGIPWYFIAAVHCMESTLNFNTHLHNGDPLGARTVNVPANRPVNGAPPFTWEVSAKDALEYEELHLWQDWSLPGLLYKLEAYNGWGYRNYHSYVLSPYLWSFSNHYTSGKYVADGSWKEDAKSQQAGAAVLLRRMVEREIIVLGDHSSDGKPLIFFSVDIQNQYAKKLQTFLNTLPGISLGEDGYAGPKTSNAFKRATGYYLQGDPRISG